MALPGRALLLIAAVITVTGLAVRAVPEAARRGPQLASAVALTVSGLVVAGGALRAGMAPVRAALPAWEADLSRYPGELAAAVGPTTWQLAGTAFLLTIAAVLALPAEIRREFAVAGAALTALAVPASLGLGWTTAPWPMVVTAIGIGVDRALRPHRPGRAWRTPSGRPWSACSARVPPVQPHPHRRGPDRPVRGRHAGRAGAPDPDRLGRLPTRSPPGRPVAPRSRCPGRWPRSWQPPCRATRPSPRRASAR